MQDDILITSESQSFDSRRLLSFAISKIPVCRTSAKLNEWIVARTANNSIIALHFQNRVSIAVAAELRRLRIESYAYCERRCSLSQDSRKKSSAHKCETNASPFRVNQPRLSTAHVTPTRNFIDLDRRSAKFIM